jgi:hypothetical protein
MQAEITSFWDWQQHYSYEGACLQALIKCIAWAKQRAAQGLSAAGVGLRLTPNPTELK